MMLKVTEDQQDDCFLCLLNYERKNSIPNSKVLCRLLNILMIIDNIDIFRQTHVALVRHIKDKKPKLNRQLYSQGASFVLGVFY